MKFGLTNKEMIEIYRNNGFTFDMIELDSFDDERIAELTGIVAGRMSNEQIDKGVNLKHIFIPFTGMNGFDVEYAMSKGIEFHVSNPHSKYVAERAMALCLAILGKITYYDSELKQNRWGDRNFSSRVSWNSLSNKRVGIYGYGTIGKILHSYIKPFTDNVTVYARTTKHDVVNVNSLEELFDVSDVVFVCVPLTKETESSINKHILSRGSGKIIVNIARGKVVDEDALYEALKTGKLEGYASDVWYQYPSKEEPIVSPSKYDLSEFNVVMTPHCGGFADDSQKLRYMHTLNQIQKKWDE